MNPAIFARKSKTKEHDDLSLGFRWRTMEGEILSLPEMKTGHIFNCAKMIFNHLAESYGANPVWFTTKYENYTKPNIVQARRLAKIVKLFILEIEWRGDLPEKYKSPYKDIVKQLGNISEQIAIEDKIQANKYVDPKIKAFTQSPISRFIDLTVGEKYGLSDTDHFSMEEDDDYEEDY